MSKSLSPSTPSSARLRLRSDTVDQGSAGQGSSAQGAAERDAAAGEMLLELERRQDDVLFQLDELDKKLTSLLSGLGVTFVEEDEAANASIRLADLDDEGNDSEDEMTPSRAEPIERSLTLNDRKAA